MPAEEVRGAGVANPEAASIAAVFAWRTLNQRRRADQRAQWWTRTQWALDAVLSGDPDRREMGLGVLELLARSRLAGTEETEIISIAWAGPLADRSDVDDGVPVNHNGEASNGSEVQQ